MNRIFTTSFALAGAALVVFACGGSTTSGGASSACDSYYDAYVASQACYLPALPASEVSRLRSRFDAECQEELSLPGQGSTTADYDACAKAILAAPCSQGWSECTNVPGTGATGSACLDSTQCGSECSFTSTSEPTDGGPQSELCGTCLASIALGQPCGDEAVGVCIAGTVCSQSSASPVCVKSVGGSEGSTCGSNNQFCATGLFCSGTTQTCLAPGGAGADCTEQTECSGTLACVDNKCAVGAAAGASCSDESACARGLGCDFTTGKCTTLTWASAGQPCSLAAPCLVGDCNDVGSSSASGTCPTVLAEGQPCPTGFAATCDTFLTCVNGVCALPTSLTCN